MSQWYHKLDQDTPEGVRNERLAYFHAFYGNPMSQQVLAHLRLHAGAWDTEGATIQERALIDQTLDAFLSLIQERAGVLDEFAMIQAEARIAGMTPLPTVEDTSGLEGFNHDDGDYR